jgi:hypothetical protein
MPRKNKRQQLLEVPPLRKVLVEPVEYPELDLGDGEEEELDSQPRLPKIVITKRQRRLEE